VSSNDWTSFTIQPKCNISEDGRVLLPSTLITTAAKAQLYDSLVKNTSVDNPLFQSVMAKQDRRSKEGSCSQELAKDLGYSPSW